jgi:hypothetical protein
MSVTVTRQVHGVFWNTYWNTQQMTARWMQVYRVLHGQLANKYRRRVRESALKLLIDSMCDVKSTVHAVCMYMPMMHR